METKTVKINETTYCFSEKAWKNLIVTSLLATEMLPDGKTKMIFRENIFCIVDHPVSHENHAQIFDPTPELIEKIVNAGIPLKILIRWAEEKIDSDFKWQQSVEMAKSGITSTWFDKKFWVGYFIGSLSMALSFIIWATFNYSR